MKLEIPGITVITRLFSVVFATSLFFVDAVPKVEAITCNHTISSDTKLIDGRTNYSTIEPGDTVCLEPGNRGILIIQNIRGSVDKPITFINKSGIVKIFKDDIWGIQVENSQYFRITGTGDPDKLYGIQIKGTRNSGITLKSKSANFEVDHIRISDTQGAGIRSKTDETCPDGKDNYYDYDGDGTIKNDKDDVVTRKSYIQRNVNFHHIKIKNVETEGFYIGSSSYNKGEKHNCNNGTVTLDPIRLHGVTIAYSIVEDSGWDGFQVGSATEDCVFHHNTVKNYGQQNEKSQRSGIVVNTGSNCDVHHNHIMDGEGAGITSQGIDAIRIYNNVVIRSGQGLKKGDDIGNGITMFTAFNHVWNNTIVSPKNFGIKHTSSDNSKHRIENNLIVDPGNGNDAFILLGGNKTTKTANNILIDKIEDAKFTNAASDDYTLQANSPAVDAGKDLQSEDIVTDHQDLMRPAGNGYDSGAHEFNGQPGTPTEPNTPQLTHSLFMPAVTVSK